MTEEHGFPVRESDNPYGFTEDERKFLNNNEALPPLPQGDRYTFQEGHTEAMFGKLVSARESMRGEMYRDNDHPVFSLSKDDAFGFAQKLTPDERPVFVEYFLTEAHSAASFQYFRSSAESGPPASKDSYLKTAERLEKSYKKWKDGLSKLVTSLNSTYPDEASNYVGIENRLKDLVDRTESTKDDSGS